MVAGLEDISGGTISIGGRVVNELTPKERDVAMVFQNYALYPHLTVGDNIAFGLRLRKTPKQRDRRARRVGRQAARPRRRTSTRKPKELSGGQRQRVAMGRAIVRHPQVVPDGRAALEPRREAARPDAGRDLEAPARARHDDDLRHPRPGRGDDDGRPGRRDEPGRPPAGRHAAAALRPAGEPLRRRLHRHAADEPARGEVVVEDGNVDRAGRRRAAALSAETLAPTRGVRGYEGREPSSWESAPTTLHPAAERPDLPTFTARSS